MPDSAVRSGTTALGRFGLTSGDVLPDLRMGWRTVGDPARDAAGRITNASLLLHATGFDSAQFLEDSLAGPLFGTGGLLDHRQHFTVIPDGIGSGASSKPSTDGGGDFPAYGYVDLVEAQRRLVTALGIEHLRLVAGTSMGGMHAWLWAERFPEAMDVTVAVAASPAPITGRNLVWRQLIIDAIRADPGYEGGDYRTSPRQWEQATSLERILTTNARVMEQDGQDRARTLASMQQDVDDARRADANDTLRQLEASADYDPSTALDAIRCRFIAVSFEDDLLNPIELGVVQHAVRRMPGAEVVVIPAGPDTAGHLTFLRGDIWIPAVQTALAS